MLIHLNFRFYDGHSILLQEIVFISIAYFKKTFVGLNFTFYSSFSLKTLNSEITIRLFQQRLHLNFHEKLYYLDNFKRKT